MKDEEDLKYPEPMESTLLYAESCLVDRNGRLESERMNDGDIHNLDQLQEEGLLKYERLSSGETRQLQSGSWRPTHQITDFSDELWERVQQLRRDRWEKSKEDVLGDSGE